MDKNRELKRFESLIIKMRSRIIELHNYNRIMKILNSIPDMKSFERVLKILSEGFKVDGCSLMVLGAKSLETIAFYGGHDIVHHIVGKRALFFASTILTDVKAQTMNTETGVLLSLPIIKGKADPFGVLNLYKTKLLTPNSELLTFPEASFPETDQRLLADITNQIGITLERFLFG